jgi:hypothetical protein
MERTFVKSKTKSTTTKRIVESALISGLTRFFTIE